MFCVAAATAAGASSSSSASTTARQSVASPLATSRVISRATRPRTAEMSASHQ